MVAAVVQHVAGRVLFVTGKIAAASGQNKLSRKLAVSDIGPNSLGGFKPMCEIEYREWRSLPKHRQTQTNNDGSRRIGELNDPLARLERQAKTKGFLPRRALGPLQGASDFCSPRSFARKLLQCANIFGRPLSSSFSH
jgi:hypothetical protein